MSQDRTNAPSDYAIRIIPGEDYLSKEQLTKRAAQFARILKSKKVTRVAFLTERRLECAELMLGAHWANANYVVAGDGNLANVSLEALMEMLKYVGPTMVVVSDIYSSMSEQLAKKIPSNIQRLMLGTPSKGWESYEALRDSQSGAPLDMIGNGEPYPTSGGSTGNPKVIKTPKRLDGKPYPTWDIMNPGRDGVVLVTRSLCGNLGLRTMLSGLLCGAQVIILKEWDERVFLQTIQDFKVTHTSLVLAQMVPLLHLPVKERNKYDLSSLQQVLHGGASCPDNVKRQFVEWFGDRLVELYGAAERFGGTVITGNEWLKHPGSAGRPFPGFRISIRNEAGKQLPPGKEGIIWFAEDAEHTPMEYLDRPEATAACYNEHGEVTARDVGYVDSESYLYVTGRAKRMIVVGRAKVYPESTEKVLGGHPDVKDIWAFGGPDVALGEKLYAFVQLRPGVKATTKFADNLVSFCQEKLGVAASPARILFVHKLPRNDSGKIDAKQIEAMETEFRKTCLRKAYDG